MSFLIPFASFVFSAALLWGGRALALKYGFADKPGGRKRHDLPVPPVGGLAVLPVFAIMAHCVAGLETVVPWPLFWGIIILLTMGAIDDAVGVKPLIKFFVMIWTCCFVVVLGEGQITELGNLFGFGEVSLGFWSEAFTVMAIVLLMNAINMIDGVDGLSGGFCALVTFWFMVVCYAAGQMESFLALSILLAALMAFLLFNMRYPFHPKATVFMGDSGTLCLGLVIGWFSVKLSQGFGTFPPLEPATVIWVIAVPVMDAFGLFLARSLRGLHPFNADRRHLHHRFLDAGISPAHTTLIMLGLIAVTASIGFSAQAYNVPEAALFWLWLAVFTAHTIGISHPRGYILLSRYLRTKLRKNRG